MDQRSQYIVPAKTLLGAILLCAVLLSSFQFVTLAGSVLCDLPCCAGRAAHAAGSCLNGSCHAFNPQPTNTQHPAGSDPLCGLSRLKLRTIQAALRAKVTVDFSSGHRHRSRNPHSGQVRLTAPVVTQPCRPDCGGVSASFTNSSRQRTPGALAYADRPEPPAVTGKHNFDTQLPGTRTAILSRINPRGPPLLSFCTLKSTSADGDLIG